MLFLKRILVQFLAPHVTTDNHLKLVPTDLMPSVAAESTRHKRVTPAGIDSHAEVMSLRNKRIIRNVFIKNV